MCEATAPIATASEDKKDELRSLLEALKKEKYLDALMDIGVASVDSLASTSLEKLTQNSSLPKMVARSLHSTMAKTYELYTILQSKGKEGFFGALMATKVFSLEDFCKATPEELPMPKMTVKVLQKKAKEAISLRPFREFLNGIGKEWCLSALVENGVKSPEDIRDSSMESLSKAVGSRMTARFLLKKAKGHCLPDDPDYKIKLSHETKQEIRSIWKSLKGHSPSFGTRFYELLVEMTERAVSCFAGICFTTLGRDFENLLDRFVSNLDSQSEFDNLSDGLVARLMRYKVPCSCVWLSDEIFKMAAINVCPELDATRTMGCWKEFHRAIFPPLHPTLLRAADSPKKKEWQEIQQDFAQKVNESFARRGYLYLTLWLNDEHSHFDDLRRVIETLLAWQEGTGSWAHFEENSRALFEKMNEQMALEFCVLTSKIVEDVYGTKIGRDVGNVLNIVACTLYGVHKLSESFRAIQIEKAYDQWSDIHQFTADEFGESFYQRFTKDPIIRATFQVADTNWPLQRERFIHQFNSIMIRISGEADVEAKQLMMQLGARHRVFYNVGKREMLAFVEPFIATLKEMIGKSSWRADTADSWAYVINTINNNMMIGWTCGVNILERSQYNPHPIDGVFNAKVLQDLRDSSLDDFQRFFVLFAKEISPGGSSVKAPARYLEAVNGVLNEPDASIAVDQIHALGRRHRKYHGGITIEVLVAASRQWMALAKIAFGDRFIRDHAVEWARLWQIIATGMSPEYMASNLSPSLEELVAPFGEKSPYLPKPHERQIITLTLNEKINQPNDMILLRFQSSAPVEMKAGHFVKLRLELPNGSKPSRFYSVASCPHPVNGTAETLEFLVKKVKGGRASPYLVDEIALNTTCELVTVAGGFVLPEPADGTRRLMVSAGVGIVAFMSAIRFVVSLVENGLVKERITLALIHSERQPSFPFLDELIAVSRKFSDHELFSFDLTLCFTGKKVNTEALAQLGEGSVISGRVGQELLSKVLNKFTEPGELPIYACGPRGFQKLVRETFLKSMGHKRSLIHLEFFDL